VGLVRRLLAAQQPDVAHLPIEVMANGWDQGLGIVALCPFYSCRVESEGLGGLGGVPGVVACRRL
jgi:hypothetical protein